LAGSDTERVADLNGLLEDDTVDAVLCARGGYGAMRLLERVNFEAVRRDPKPLIGYSDITALSLSIAAQTGVVSFSGIMASAGDGFGQPGLNDFSEASFWQAVGQTALTFARPPDGPHAEAWQTVRGPNVVTGRVFPVCLTLLNALVGTPYCPDLTGAILVLEDVGEEWYRVDRYLTHLRLAGVLNSVAAVLLGTFNAVPHQSDILQTEVLRLVETLCPPHVAVASGVAYGHIPQRLTLPVGAVATVDLHAGTFTYTR
jgi:muramoyltetrapeptide carboxypeptidase